MIPYGKAALLGLAIVNGHSLDLNAGPDDPSFEMQCVVADAFASVVGFRFMVATDVQHLFGMSGLQSIFESLPISLR